MPLDSTGYVTTTLCPAAALLMRAADIVERGWCQGHLVDDHGNVCALQALYHARGKVTQAFVALSNAVGGNIPEWNNAPSQTAANVAATMRAVAMRLAMERVA